MSDSVVDFKAFQKTKVQVSLPLNYLHYNSSPANSEKPLLLFFHGYSDSAAALLKRAFPDLDSKYEILAPNGLFPVPVQRETGWKPAYAWYFADYSKNEVVIPPSVSAEAIGYLLKDLGLEQRPKAVIGFSQGGFFIPYILPRLKNVRGLFALGAGYRSSDYLQDLPVPLDAFHGSEDSVIPLAKAKESFEDFKSKNPRGQFFEFSGLAHTLNDEARAVLKARIEAAFQ